MKPWVRFLGGLQRAVVELVPVCYSLDDVVIVVTLIVWSVADAAVAGPPSADMVAVAVVADSPFVQFVALMVGCVLCFPVSLGLAGSGDDFAFLLYRCWSKNGYWYFGVLECLRETCLDLQIDSALVQLKKYSFWWFHDIIVTNIWRYYSANAARTKSFGAKKLLRVQINCWM